MQKSSLSLFLIAALTITTAISSSLPTALAATYLPAVIPGQSAEYKPLYYNCYATVSISFCEMDTTGFQDVDRAGLDVVEVSGTSVTLSMTIVYKNGTVTQEGALLDVDTGFANITSFGTGNYFVLAGNLQAHDPIWNTEEAPVLNETSTKSILGISREVNFLNFTSSFGAGGYSVSSSSGFAYDRVSGILIEVAVSFSSPFGTVEFAIGMVDNNIWSGSAAPDFAISNSGSIAFQAGFSGTVTITLAALNGFSSTVSLAVSSTPSGLTCSLDKNSIAGAGSATLTCQGQPGTYTVTITASSGYTTRTTQTTVTVNRVATPSQAASQQIPFLYIGSGVAAAIIIVLAALLLLRRKPEETEI